MKADSSKLEFPDWSGMDDSSARLTSEAAFQLCEKSSALFPEAVKKWRATRPEKIEVEFVL